MNNNGYFEVSDMYFAAALLSYGVGLKGIDKSVRSRIKFKFSGPILSIVVAVDDVVLETKKNVEISVAQTHYISKELWLPPSYPDAVRSIKSAIHS